MPAIRALALVLPLLAAPAHGTDPLADYARLLGTYVEDDGVRYRDWRSSAGDVAALRDVVAALSATDPSTLAGSEKTAFYINLYNAKILQLVVEGDPEDSIRDLSRWFSFTGKFEIFFRDVLLFDGENISLHALEKRLRKESADPRIHFAINCASRSCPPLAGQPFRAASLDAALDRMTRTYLATRDGAVVEPGGDVRVSKIFDWFDDDFGGKSGTTAFLREYAPAEVRRALDAGGRLRYLDYDWSLNRSTRAGAGR